MGWSCTALHLGSAVAGPARPPSASRTPVAGVTPLLHRRRPRRIGAHRRRGRPTAVQLRRAAPDRAVRQLRPRHDHRRHPTTTDRSRCSERSSTTCSARASCRTAWCRCSPGIAVPHRDEPAAAPLRSPLRRRVRGARAGHRTPDDPLQRLHPAVRPADVAHDRDGVRHHGVVAGPARQRWLWLAGVMARAAPAHPGARAHRLPDRHLGDLWWYHPSRAADPPDSTSRSP